MNKHETHKTIHVVEDEHAIREILLQMLSGCGFRVRTFMSGESYLAYMQKDGFGMPTVLLSDINMPGMNGLQLLREVQQRHPDLCCMLMTGNPDQCAERHLRQYGLTGRVRHVFEKPFSPLLLTETLESI
jgi:two-component system nitrogen regulation response regulator GlnG